MVRAEYDANADTLQGVLEEAGWGLGEAVAVEVQPTVHDLRLVALETHEIAGDDSAEAGEAA